MDIEKFIELVKKHPILYDRRHRGYQNVARKAKIWDSIAREMNESSEALRTKWKGLKDGYTKFQKQAKDYNNASTCAKAFNKWCWAEYLHFLDNCGKPPKSNGTSIDENSLDAQLPPSTQSESTSQHVPTTPPLENEIFFLETAEALQKQQTLQTLTSNPPQEQRSSKRSHSTISVDDGERIHLKREKRAKASDSIDLLFKSYAETFKGFSVRRQVSIKVHLAKLFADAEMQEAQGTSIVFSSSGAEGGHDYAVALEKGNQSANSQNEIQSFEVLQLEESFPLMKHSPTSDRSSID